MQKKKKERQENLVKLSGISIFLVVVRHQHLEDEGLAKPLWACKNGVCLLRQYQNEGRLVSKEGLPPHGFHKVGLHWKKTIKSSLDFRLLDRQGINAGRREIGLEELEKEKKVKESLTSLRFFVSLVCGQDLHGQDLDGLHHQGKTSREENKGR